MVKPRPLSLYHPYHRSSRNPANPSSLRGPETGALPRTTSTVLASLSQISLSPTPGSLLPPPSFGDPVENVQERNQGSELPEGFFDDISNSSFENYPSSPNSRSSLMSDDPIATKETPLCVQDSTLEKSPLTLPPGFFDDICDSSFERLPNVEEWPSRRENGSADSAEAPPLCSHRVEPDEASCASRDVGTVSINRKSSIVVTPAETSLCESSSFCRRTSVSERKISSNHPAVAQATLNVVNQILQLRKLPDLYPWQRRFLEVFDRPYREQHRNILLSVSTSGGKSLVAEVYLILELLGHRSAILMLPFVALVQEKVQSLSSLACVFRFHVEEYAHTKGHFPPIKRKKPTLYVATIEKAHTLFNSLVSEDRGPEIGLVVVDEIHMLGTDQRGTEIEAFLCKVMCFDSQIKILGMSATVGNLGDIARFMDDAILFKDDFRPVPLEEHLVMRRHIFRINPNPHENEVISVLRDLQEQDLKDLNPYYKLGSDRDLITLLVAGAQCLVFCATKKHCESMAVLLATSLPSPCEDVRILLQFISKEIVEANDGAVLEPLLDCVLRGGVAYHHSALSAATRQSIEDGFRRTLIRVICCTSTLAAGVNLPAQRVVIRSPFLGRQELSRSQYLQMIGRAGRAGFDLHGEAYLVCSEDKMDVALRLIRSEPDISVSQLLKHDRVGWSNLLLSLIGFGIARTRIQLAAAVMKTLAWLQAASDPTVNIRVELYAELRRLQREDLIYEKFSDNGCDEIEFNVTDFGRAALKTGVAPFQVKAMKDRLLQLSSPLHISSPLQLLCICMPPDRQILIQHFGVTRMVQLMRDEHHRVASVLGITAQQMCRLHRGQMPDDCPGMRSLYAAMMIIEIWKGASPRETALNFYENESTGITEINDILTHLDFQISQIQRFAEFFDELWVLASVLPAFQARLSTHCIRRHLNDLLELPSVKKGRGQMLYDAGFKTLEDVAIATVENLCHKIPSIPRKQGQAMISSARMILKDRLALLKEEKGRFDDLLLDGDGTE